MNKCESEEDTSCLAPLALCCPCLRHIADFSRKATVRCRGRRPRRPAAVQLKVLLLPIRILNFSEIRIPKLEFAEHSASHAPLCGTPWASSPTESQGKVDCGSEIIKRLKIDLIRRFYEEERRKDKGKLCCYR